MSFPVKIHPSSIVDEGAIIGEGTSIWHFSHICSGAVIGKNCSIGQNVLVADNAILGNGVKIQNNVAIYGGVTVEDDVFLGPSCVLTNVTNPRSQVSRKTLYEKTFIRREGLPSGLTPQSFVGLLWVDIPSSEPVQSLLKMCLTTVWFSETLESLLVS